jgi:hypothetical protein
MKANELNEFNELSLVHCPLISFISSISLARWFSNPTHCIPAGSVLYDATRVKRAVLDPLEELMR